MALAFVTGQVASNGTSAAGVTVAAAFPGNVTSGSLLWCSTRVSHSTTSHAISDNLGDGVSWNEWVAADITQATDGHRAKVFWKIAGASGACTVTATFGATARRGLTIREFSGPDATPEDVTNESTGADAAPRSGSVTMTDQGVICSSWGYSGNQTTTIDTDYASLTQNSTGRMGSCHRVTTAITDEAIHTASAANNWSCVSTVFVQVASGGTALSGASPSSVWTIAAIALVAGTVALSGTSPATAWTVPALNLAAGSVALSGTSPSSSWAVPGLSLSPGVVALSGTTPATTWSVAAIDIQASGGQQALSGANPAATWAVPATALTPGAVGLSGSSPSSSWMVPTLALTPGAAVLTGTTPAASWHGASIDLIAEGGPQTLSGSSPATTWVVAPLALAPGVVALSGVVPASTWVAAAIDVVPGAAALAGTSPAATWIVPPLSIAGGVLPLVSTVSAVASYSLVVRATGSQEAGVVPASAVSTVRARGRV